MPAPALASLPSGYRALIFGAGGGIGSALLVHLQNDARCGDVIGLSRRSDPAIELREEASLAHAAQMLRPQAPFHLMIDATGILVDDGMPPEKCLSDITPEALHAQFAVNAIGPALLLKHFHALLPREGKAIFASLSAKVGSIGDNRLGGWYGYRASKAALNMLLKSAAIEIARKRPQAVIVGLHPGTVDTALSQPFSGNVKHEIFSATHAAAQLLSVLDSADASQTGALLHYDGTRLPY